MPNAARISDVHVCPLQTPGTPPTPHVGGMVIAGAPNVLIGGLPAARVSDALLCNGVPPHPDTIIKGSATVLIGGLPAARMGDTTSVGGTIQMGAPTVIIGG
jgi:uncharacterized Zn-binding protein involved in type VI secretion